MLWTFCELISLSMGFDWFDLPLTSGAFEAPGVRFCLKHFRDITIFTVSNFIILYKSVLN